MGTTAWYSGSSRPHRPWSGSRWAATSLKRMRTMGRRQKSKTKTFIANQLARENVESLSNESSSTLHNTHNNAVQQICSIFCLKQICWTFPYVQTYRMSDKTCPDCQHVCSTKSNLKKHMMWKKCVARDQDKIRSRSRSKGIVCQKEKVTIENITENNVELTMEPHPVEESLVCYHCEYTFTEKRNFQEHKCRLLPSLDKSYTVLRLLNAETAEQFKRDHRSVKKSTEVACVPCTCTCLVMNACTKTCSEQL